MTKTEAHRKKVQEKKIVKERQSEKVRALQYYVATENVYPIKVLHGLIIVISDNVKPPLIYKLLSRLQ